MSDDLKAAAERKADGYKLWSIENGREGYEVNVQRNNDNATLADAYLARLAADEAERELSAKCRAEWLRRMGQTDTEAPVGTLAAERGQLMAMLAIERKADEAKRAERFGATERLTAWIRDYGHEKQPVFIADLRVVLGVETKGTT